MGRADRYARSSPALTFGVLLTLEGLDGVHQICYNKRNGERDGDEGSPFTSWTRLSSGSPKAGRATKEPFELRLVVLTSASCHLKTQYLGEALLSSDRIVLYKAQLPTATYTPLVLTSYLDRTRLRDDSGYTIACCIHSPIFLRV